MGNSIGGKRRRARVMTVDGATHKYRAPAAAADALRGHPGHHLLESDEVRRLGVRARPLDPDAPLKPGKLYFLVEIPRLAAASSSSNTRRRAPQRTWSGALTYGAGERLESLMLARRSASDVAAALAASSSSPGPSSPSVEAAARAGRRRRAAPGAATEGRRPAARREQPRRRRGRRADHAALRRQGPAPPPLRTRHAARRAGAGDHVVDLAQQGR
uniref:Uncharacterized protein n=1 Tax=Setaria italica TaxID=4555 RepID=K3YJM4_SETIT